MLTAYLFDDMKIYLSSVELDPLGPIPSNSTFEEPPVTSGAEVVQRRGNSWVVLPSVESLPVPPPLVPEFISTWQARAILIDEGLLEEVYNFFHSLPSPEDEKAVSKFEHSPTVYRTDPFVLMVIPALGRTEAQIDDMFIRGNKLT